MVKRPKPVIDRFMEKIQKTPDGCWLWTGAIVKGPCGGYAHLAVDGKPVIAHRWAYQEFVGEIPKGLVLDHTCRNRHCVNPEHLQPVTHAENVRRGISGAVNRARWSLETHCKRGHLFDEGNTCYRASGRRMCRACNRIRQGDERARYVISNAGGYHHAKKLPPISQELKLQCEGALSKSAA